MIWKRALAFAGILLVGVRFLASAQDSSGVVGPIEHAYATHDGVDLKAYVFAPVGHTPDMPRPAILVLHGGGWHIGAPEWAFGRARHFAELGMVAIPVQYRLSDQKSITPLEAIAKMALANLVRGSEVTIYVDGN